MISIRNTTDTNHPFQGFRPVSFVAQITAMTSTLAYSANQAAVNSSSTPCISIVMPFEPKMTSKAELQKKVDSVCSFVKSELLLHYAGDQCEREMKRLNNVIATLDYLTYKRSVAIFISNSVERVYYLDLEVKLKVVVGNPFHMTDLVRNKVENHGYLVLALDEKWTRIYRGTATQFIRLVSNVAEHVYSYRRDSLSNTVTDANEKLNRFLKYTDESLSILLRSYPLPLFIIGTQKIIGKFRKVCTNKGNIVGYISGNVDKSPESAIRALVSPHVANWSLVKEHFLFNQMQTAEKEGKLATGIGEVWKEANYKNGKILIVENGYMNDGMDGSRIRAIFRNAKAENPFCISDEIDQLIEKVLQCGGDVEFVQDGSLDDYQRIALIKEY